jgi:hypothetical protein
MSEWTAESGALARSELHESCVRLAQAVIGQVDPDARARIAKTP